MRHFMVITCTPRQVTCVAMEMHTKMCQNHRVHHYVNKTAMSHLRMHPWHKPNGILCTNMQWNAQKAQHVPHTAWVRWGHKQYSRLVDWLRVHCWVVWLSHQPLNFLASSLCSYLSSTLALLVTTSGGLVHWTKTSLSDRSPPSSFILFTSSSVTNFSWYNSDSTVWDSSTDT